MLISTKPKTAGEKAVIARSRQLTDFSFTPLRDIPNHIKGNVPVIINAGQECSGFPYSSNEINDKFLAENVSFETYLSALSNPDSVLYTKNIYGNSNGSTYYGIVCNSFVRYAFNIKRRISTALWPDIPGMKFVAEPASYKVEKIKLCDVLYAYGNGRNHVALITDILRDESGEIREIEVSEATHVFCIRERFTVDKFYETYKLFGLCRYDGVDEVPMPDEGIDELLFNSDIAERTPNVAVNYGNKSNYLEGEETVISTFKKGENRVEIIKDGKIYEKAVISGRGTLIRTLPAGYYEIKLEGSSDSVEFCVCKAVFSHTVKDGKITVKAVCDDENSKLLYIDYRKAGEKCAPLCFWDELTDNEKKTGEFTRVIPDGAENLKVYFENKYGVWTQRMRKIY